MTVTREPQATRIIDPVDTDRTMGTTYGRYEVAAQYENTLKQSQEQDELIGPIIRYLRSQEPGAEPSDEQFEDKTLTLAKDCHLSGGLLYRLWDRRTQGRGPYLRRQLVVPKDYYGTILEFHHDNHISGGHLGINHTYEKIAERYWWPGMFGTIRNFVKSCERCNQRKSSSYNPNYSHQGRYVPRARWEVMSIDIMGPLPLSVPNQNKYILVMNDHLTRWTVAIAIPNHTASQVAATIFSHIICQFGCPRTILSDQGAEFIGSLMKEFYEIFGITKVTTTAYHPQGNGVTERRNRDIVNCISTYIEEGKKVNHDDWDQYLDAVSFVLNTTVHSATGYSPYRLMFGYEARFPLDVMLNLSKKGYDLNGKVPYYELLQQIKYELAIMVPIARHHLSKQNHEWESAINHNRSINSYKPGQVVFVRFPQPPRTQNRKLYSSWAGKYKVLRQISSVTYEVQLISPLPLAPRDTLHVHVTRMKPYHARTEDAMIISSNPQRVREFHEIQAQDAIQEQQLEQEELKEGTQQQIGSKTLCP